MCTLIDFVPIRKRESKDDSVTATLTSTEKHQYLLKKINIFNNDPNHLEPFYSYLKESLNTYGYADSILMSFDGYEYFKSAGFDFLIRSDMDVFLTPRN